MSAFTITNADLLLPGKGVSPGVLLVLDGKIAAIDPTAEQIPADCEQYDAQGALLTPGLIDIHTHGIHEYQYERDPQELVDGCALLAQYGTTCVLPTLYGILDPSLITHLEGLSEALDHVTGVNAPGFHFEGPFLALPGAGARTIPGDLGLLEELLAAANGRVTAMSVSPDTPNVMPVIERLCEKNISVFITHTKASVELTRRAIDEGARHATHFCNVFPVPPEPEPGVRPVGAVEAVLADPRCTVDFICDGVHVDPILIQLALRAKGPQGVSAITDSNVGAGAKAGVYGTSWGYSVKASPTEAVRVLDEDHPLCGLLAGSSLTMNRAVSNLLTWLENAEPQVWAMATCNPASAAGIENKGTLQVGADADLVLWNRSAGQLQVERTWVCGQCVFAARDSAVT